MAGLPRISVLRECVRDAVRELVSNIAIVFLPVWLGLLFAWLSSDTSIGIFVSTFFSSGDILLISPALVGPLIYVIFRKYGDLPKNLTLRFPGGWLYVFTILVICVIGSAIFGYSSALPINNKFDPLNMQILSVLVIGISFVVLLCVYATRNYIDIDPARFMQTDTGKFLEEWDRS